MNLTSKLATPTKQNRDLPLAERAELACRLAKQFEKAGEYEAAAEALHEFWRDGDEAPNVAGLDESTKADVLLRCGALARYSSSSRQVSGNQEKAKNLITQAIEIFEELGKHSRATEARSDLALCYWYEGSYDEARILLEKALKSLGDENTETRAILLVRAGIVALWSGRLNEALRLYELA